MILWTLPICSASLVSLLMYLQNLMKCKAPKCHTVLFEGCYVENTHTHTHVANLSQSPSCILVPCSQPFSQYSFRAGVSMWVHDFLSSLWTSSSIQFRETFEKWQFFCLLWYNGLRSSFNSTFLLCESWVIGKQ